MNGPRWSETTAVFGGTFDPPHLGHREAVAGLFKQPGVSRVLILPGPRPPHKAAFADVDDRIKMTQLAFADMPVSIDLRELKRAELNPGIPSYSFDTLNDLRREFRELAFVVGTDQLEKLSTWYRFPEVLGLCHWIVLARQETAAPYPILSQWEAGGLVRQDAGRWQIKAANAPRWIQVVPTEARAISSTKVRETLARSGSPPEGSLSLEVVDYLKQRGLYGMRKPT